MATASAKETLDALLAGPLTRENFDELLTHLYEGYGTVDLADSRIRELEAQLADASGEEARQLAERLGILCLARGNYQEAVKHLHPLRTKAAAYFLGRACLRLGNEREALEHLERGRAGDDDVATDVLLTEVYCSLREEDKAAKLLKAHGDPAESAGLQYAWGRVAEAQGDYEEAMRCYEAAVQKDPNHPGALFRLALNCDMNGEDDRAMELYRRCAALRPTFVGALVNLGVLYEDHGMYYDAIECYKRVLAIEPRNRQVQLFLKDAESSISMYVEMIKSRRRIEDVFSLPPGSLKALGVLPRPGEEQPGERTAGEASPEELEELLARYNSDVGDTAGAAGDAARATDSEEGGNISMPIDEMELSTRCRKCMERLGIKAVRELTQLTEGQLLAVPNFGTTSLNEIKLKLAALGLSLKGE